MAIHIDEPTPRTDPEIPRSFSWPTRRKFICPPVTPPPVTAFATVVEQRRSVRFMAPVAIRELVNFMAYSTRPRFLRNDPARESLRLSPSAGALHCIDTLLIDWRTSRRVARYDPSDHTLDLLHIAKYDYLDKFVSRCEAILPNASQTAIVLVADLPRINSKYENPESLIWRDAGILLQVPSRSW